MDRTRILVVEDDDVFRAMMAEFLARGGFHASVASGRDEALVLADREGYDVAVIDLNLKRSHGLDVAAELRQRNPDLHLIFISGDVEGLTRGREMPAGSCKLQKPLNLQELQILLENSTV